MLAIYSLKVYLGTYKYGGDGRRHHLSSAWYTSEGSRAGREREQNCSHDDLVRGLMHPGASVAGARYVCLFYVH